MVVPRRDRPIRKAQNVFVKVLKCRKRSRARWPFWVLVTCFALRWLHICSHVEDYPTTLRVGPKRQRELGAIVILAPPRYEGSVWRIDRFCLLLRAVRSLDQHLNAHYGPYPIHILIATDYDQQQHEHHDGIYTEYDRELLQRWAPNSHVQFQEISLYSGEALEPNTSPELIWKWRSRFDGSVPGRTLGYTSMCRLWSGRMQAMPFLQSYQYYLRMDDDSLLTGTFPFDPFVRMKDQNLMYAYKRASAERWGIKELWDVSKPHIVRDESLKKLPFMYNSTYYAGSEPYNNFHVSSVAFWASPPWQKLWEDLNQHHVFFKYRVGDANVHAFACMMMQLSSNSTVVAPWSKIPYVHNSNDMKSFGQKEWQEECQRDYQPRL